MERKGKKIFIILSTVLLLMSVIPFSVASAATNPPPIALTVTASKTAANVGEEITFTIAMGSATGTDLSGFSFALDLPAGMTFKSAAFTPAFVGATANWDRNFVEKGEATNATMLQFSAACFHEDGTGEVAVPDPSTPTSIYNGAGIQIATFVCTATTSGSKTVTLKDVGFYSQPATVVISTPVTAATVTVSGGSGKGDINSDKIVNGLDIAELLKYFGQAGAAITNSAADVNDDEIVNGLDIAELLKYFGQSY